MLKKIISGKINKFQSGIYSEFRVFDIGDSIDLEKAKYLIANNKIKYTEEKNNSAKTQIILKNTPIVINKNICTIKIWEYGVISLRFDQQLENKTYKDLITISNKFKLGENKQFEETALQIAQMYFMMINKAINNPALNKYIIEDYSVVFMRKIKGIKNDARLLLKNKFHLSEIIQRELQEKLSKQTKQESLKGRVAYAENDLTIIDWNSAVIYAPDNDPINRDILEFCLTHLLELRYYDNELGKKIEYLQKRIENKAVSKKLLKEADKMLLEITELMSELDNSLNIVGDPFLARVFKTASEQFRLKDWKSSINNKREDLKNIIDSIRNEVAINKSHLLEMIVIILIMLELPQLPVLFDLVMKLINEFINKH